MEAERLNVNDIVLTGRSLIKITKVSKLKIYFDIFEKEYDGTLNNDIIFDTIGDTVDVLKFNKHLIKSNSMF